MKRLLALMMCAVSLGVMAQLPDHVPTDGLIGWWPLNGNANDDGPSTIDGTVFGASPSLDRWGDASGAMSFQDIGERIELGEISGNLGLPNTELTISCWFKGEAYPANGQSTGQLVSAYYGPGDRQIRLEVVHGIGNGPGDHLKYYWRCPEENDEPVSTNQFSTSDWNHYVMTVDPMSSEVRITLNGLLVQDMIAPYSPSNDYRGTETRNWMFGSYHPQINSVPHQFVGDLDDIGIWNRALSQDEIMALYNASGPVSGCTDAEACNFNEDATIDDETCHFLCQYCIDGTIWNEELHGCVHGQSADINNDGCVQLGDLLDLLGAYGDCGAEEQAWQCGDSLEYQGYDYETVQIGDQCWFAENLRAENYRNGENIPHGESNWSTTTEGAKDFGPIGVSYNGFAVLDGRQLCPNQWHVSLDTDWVEMETLLGMDDANDFGMRGTNQGTVLKATSGWSSGGSGTDAVGFSAIPESHKQTNGAYINNLAIWWCPQAESLISRNLNPSYEGVYRYQGQLLNDGLSIRCIKDSE